MRGRDFLKDRTILGPETMPYARKNKQRITALKRVASAIKLAIEGAGQTRNVSSFSLW